MFRLLCARLVFCSAVAIVLIYGKVTESVQTEPDSISSWNNAENRNPIHELISQLRGVQYALASVRLDLRHQGSEMKRQISSVRDTVLQEQGKQPNDDSERHQHFKALQNDMNYERLVRNVITQLTGINSGMDSIRLQVNNYTDMLNVERMNEIELVKSEMAAVKESVVKMQIATDEMKEQGLAKLKSEIMDLIEERDSANKINIENLQQALNLMISKMNDTELESSRQTGTILEQLDTARASQDFQQKSLNQTLDEITLLASNIDNQTAQIKLLENTTTFAAEKLDRNFDKFDQMNSSVFGNFDVIKSNIEGVEPKLSTVIEELNEIQDTFNIQNTVLQNVVRSKDCCSVQRSGYVKSGIFAIYPYRNDLSKKVKAYCDFDTDGGGWTVFQRREEDMGQIVDFDQDWNAYESGFGNQSYSFWLGLPHIAALTDNRKQSLRVEMTDWDNESKFAQYDWFKVHGSSDLYRMTVSGYSGSVGDSLVTAYSSYNSSGMAFSTKDRDNDLSGDNCARNYNGGWWFNERSHVNPNGLYKLAAQSTQGENGIFWHDFKNTLFYSLKHIEFKVRPGDYPQGCRG